MFNIKKRDGKVVNYDIEKIKIAILKASEASNQIIKKSDLNNILKKIDNEIQSYDNILSVYDIERIVENVLMKSSYSDVAREYIGFRRHRDIVRNEHSDMFNKVRGLFNGTDRDVIAENANKDAEVIPVKRDLLAGILSREFGVNYMMPKEVAKNHNEGYIHFHDTDYSPLFNEYNCMLIDFKTMFQKGFKLGNAPLSYPKSIGVATAVTAQIIAQVASHIYGGNSFNRIDEVLDRFVSMSFAKNFIRGYKWIEGKELEYTKDEDNRYFIKDTGNEICHSNDYLRLTSKKAFEYAEEVTEKDTYDAFQGLEYEINTLHTANGQTPFSTFGFGLGTSWESRLIQKSILKVRIEGLGENKKTAIFPKLVFVIKKGINYAPEDPNYDIKQLAIECSTKRLYPDILSYDKIVEFTGNFKFPMGCRSFLGKWTNSQGEEVNDGRNNLGVISINLVRIALETGNIKDFYKLLDEKLEVCKEGLLFRINRLLGTKASVAPILYQNGALGHYLNSNDDVDFLFKNGRASISLGYIGLHETVLALTGKKMFGNPEIKQIGIDILQHLRDKCDEWKKETGYGFSLYGTPSENLCYKFERLDREKFGIIPGITDKEWYTNSFHLDVEQECTAFEKIDFEAPFQKISSGGFITYVECNSLIKNPKALERLWDYAIERVGYFAINVHNDQCFKCKYEGDFVPTEYGFQCPNCGNTDPKEQCVVRRISGYLTDGRPINKGKFNEIINRVVHY